MPEEAVLDAAPDTGAEVSTDAGAQPDGFEATSDTQTSESTDSEQGAQGQQKPLQLLQERNGQKVLNPEARKQIDELLKTVTDPKQQAILRQMRSTLFDQARQLSAVGPVQQVRETLQEIEKFGGLPVIQEIKADSDFLTNVSEYYRNGDPRFLDVLLKDSDPRVQEQQTAAFAQHAPGMMAKWAELQPDSHASYVAQATLDYFNRAGLSTSLELLGYLLPSDNPQLAEVYQRIKAAFTGLAKMAEKPLAPVRQAPVQDDSRERELSQREAKIKEQEWNGRTEAIGNQIRQAELNRVLNGRKLDADTEQAVLANIHLKLTELLPPDFDAKMQRFYDTGQQDAFLKLYRATMQQIAPKAVAWAVRVTNLGSAKPGPKAGQPRTNGQPGARRAEPAVQPQNGFKMVNAYPVGKIDVVRTTRSMLAAKTAILKDGSKVQWK